jgi:hypothetical protein
MGVRQKYGICGLGPKATLRLTRSAVNLQARYNISPAETAVVSGAAAKIPKPSSWRGSSEKLTALRHVLTRPEQMWNGAEPNGICLLASVAEGHPPAGVGDRIDEDPRGL